VMANDPQIIQHSSRVLNWRPNSSAPTPSHMGSERLRS